MPYSLYEKQYSSWSQFVWVSPRPEPKYDHAVFHSFWVDWDAADKQFQRQHILFVHGRDLVKLRVSFCGYHSFCCVAVSSPRLLRNRRLRIPLLFLSVFYLGLAFESDLAPHYFAPATVLLFLIATAAVQDISARFPQGKRRALATVALFYCIGVIRASLDHLSFIWSSLRSFTPVLHCRTQRRARALEERARQAPRLRSIRSASLYPQRVGVQ